MRGAPDSRTARDALLSPQHPGSGMQRPRPCA
jgi:hypothetical protein